LLTKLINEGHLRAALNQTTQLLTEHGQGPDKAHTPSQNSPESLQLWACRFQLLMALHMQTEMHAEWEALEELDAPDLYLQFYPERFGTIEGSIVPFCLRVIHAESARFTADPLVAIARIQSLTAIVDQMVNNLVDNLSEDGKRSIDSERKSVGLAIWNARLRLVAKTMTRILFHLKEFNLTKKSVLEQLNLIVGEARIPLMALLTRLSLHGGDDLGSMHYVEQISKSSSEYKNHKVLYSVFHANYTQACDQLLKAIASGQCDANTVNNAAVCLLYMGRLHEAVALLEKNSAITNEPMTRNLSSLYELTSNRSTVKKEQLMKRVMAVQPDAFNFDCFKLS